LPLFDHTVEEQTRRQKAALGLRSEAFAQAGRRAKVEESSRKISSLTYLTSTPFPRAVANLKSRICNPQSEI
jgi:hypothetical protein